MLFIINILIQKEVKYDINCGIYYLFFKEIVYNKSSMYNINFYYFLLNIILLYFIINLYKINFFNLIKL